MSSMLTMSPDRDRLLMSDELRSLVGDLRSDDSVAPIPIATEPMLVLKYAGNDVNKHIIGKLISIEVDSSSAIASLRVENHAYAFDIMRDLAKQQTECYECLQVDCDSSDVNTVMAFHIKKIDRIRICDVTSAGTCTLTIHMTLCTEKIT